MKKTLEFYEDREKKRAESNKHAGRFFMNLIHMVAYGAFLFGNFAIFVILSSAWGMSGLNNNIFPILLAVNGLTIVLLSYMYIEGFGSKEE